MCNGHWIMDTGQLMGEEEQEEAFLLSNCVFTVLAEIMRV